MSSTSKNNQIQDGLDTLRREARWTDDHSNFLKKQKVEMPVYTLNRASQHKEKRTVRDFTE